MMSDLISYLVSNLGFTFENLILLMIIFIAVIFCAADLRIGIIGLFLMNVLAYIVFTELGMSMAFVTISLLVSFVIMTLALYLTFSRKSEGVSYV